MTSEPQRPNAGKIEIVGADDISSKLRLLSAALCAAGSIKEAEHRIGRMFDETLFGSLFNIEACGNGAAYHLATTSNYDDVISRLLNITDDVIKAGVLAFVNYDSRFEGPENCVYDIYIAMWAASQKS